MNRRLKVLLLTDDALIGGGQQHVLSLARGIDLQRFDVAVACPKSGFLVDELRRSKIRHFAVELPEWPSWKALRTLRDLVKSFKPDIIHSHGGTAGFYGRISSLMILSARKVHTYHGIHYLNFRGGWKRHMFKMIDRLLLGVTDRLICVAQSDFELGLRAGVVTAKKGAVIPNGIDVRKFAGSKRRPGEGRSARRMLIGTVGRLHVQKGHEVLLNAARVVLDVNPDISFCIIGEGDLRDHLASVARRLGIESRVSFPGVKTDIRRQLSRMDVFVLPSLWEGFPIVLLEAMAAGKPIVATGVNGVREILEHGKNGLLVPPNDPAALAEALLRMVKDRKLAVSCASHALAKVRSTLTEEEMIRRTERVYTQ